MYPKKINKYKLIILLLPILQVLFLAGNNSANAHNYKADHTINIKAVGFEPVDIKINIGEEIIFYNDDSTDHWPASNLHPTHEIYPEFDPQKPLSPGEDWHFIPNKVGRWEFHDHLYPNRTGTITVVTKTQDNQLEQNSRGSVLKKLWDYPANMILNILKFVKNKIHSNPPNIVFKEPENIDFTLLLKQTEFNCSPDDFECVADILKKITAKYGPINASDILFVFKEAGKMGKAIDEHQLTHIIGRETAQTFGINANSFLLCPMGSGNDGCQHGFFEYALGKSDTPIKAAYSICDSLDKSFSAKFEFYCYHGIGHGILMAQAYDLNKALLICDKFEKSSSVNGCWQGVFMEQVGAFIDGNSRKDIFSESDPLAPCNKIDDKYRKQCFENHAAYLITIFKGSMLKAGQACLKAETYKSICGRGLGVSAAAPAWQQILSPESKNKKDIGIAAKLCTQVPGEIYNFCLTGVVDDFINNDGAMNIKARAIPFCKLVPENNKESCYKEIGINIAWQVNDPASKMNLCGQIEEKYQKTCISTAGYTP